MISIGYVPLPEDIPNLLTNVSSRVDIKCEFHPLVKSIPLCRRFLGKAHSFHQNVEVDFHIVSANCNNQKSKTFGPILRLFPGWVGFSRAEKLAPSNPVTSVHNDRRTASLAVSFVFFSSGSTTWSDTSTRSNFSGISLGWSEQVSLIVKKTIRTNQTKSPKNCNKKKLLMIGTTKCSRGKKNINNMEFTLYTCCCSPYPLSVSYYLFWSKSLLLRLLHSRTSERMLDKFFRETRVTQWKDTELLPTQKKNRNTTHSHPNITTFY